MSNISNRHSVLPFTAGKSVPLTNQRLIRVLYKPSKKIPQKFPSVCVSVPKIDEPLSPDVLNKLNPYIIEMIQKAQDGIVKNMYEAANGKLGSIGDDDISIEKVLEYLEAESTGGRMTKESLYSYFDEFIKDYLVITLAEKLNIDDVDDPRIVKGVNGYREMISALSSGVVVYNENQVKSLIKAIELGGMEDDVSQKLVKRLNNMISKKEDEELIAL